MPKKEPPITKARLCSRVDELRDRLSGVARAIYERPEVCFHEVFASELLAREAGLDGFEVTMPAGGLATAFTASHPARAAGPKVAFLAEYDALPGVGHACGHHLIAAASLGAALALGSFKRDLPGELRLYGTPAEEGGSGKVLMIQAGLFDDVDAALMFHPDSKNVVGDTSLAVKEVTFRFHGREAHASSCPERGVNALDACIQTFNGIAALRQHLRRDARVHGIITDGGERPNIVPGFAEAYFFVRAQDDEYLEEVLARVTACAHAGAQAAGARVEVEVGTGCRALNQDAELTRLFKGNAESLGLVFEERGSEMGSTDMGDVTQITRAIHPYVAIVPKGQQADFHSKQFAEVAIAPPALEATVAAAKALAMTGLDVLTSPSFARR